MNKKSVWTLIGALAIASLLVVGCAPEAAPSAEEEEEGVTTPEEEEEAAPAAPAAETYNWDCQSFMATGEPEWPAFQEMFVRVSEMSGGRLNITTYPSGALASGWSIPDCVP